MEAGGNVRQLDAAYISALTGSMAVRGLIVAIAVRPLDGDRFASVAGEHAEGTSGHQGAEKVLRKTLTLWRSARVGKMLGDGAATVLGGTGVA